MVSGDPYLSPQRGSGEPSLPIGRLPPPAFPLPPPPASPWRALGPAGGIILTTSETAQELLLLAASLFHK